MLRWLPTLALPALIVSVSAGQPPSELDGKLVELQKKTIELLKARKPAESLPLFEQQLDLLKQKFPPELNPDGHVQIAMTLFGLGAAHEARGDKPHAGDAFARASRMIRAMDKAKKGGEPMARTMLPPLAQKLTQSGEYREAIACFDEVLSKMRQQNPEGNPAMIGTMLSLGLAHHGNADYPRAEASYREALALCRRLFPKEQFPNGNPLVSASLINLGAALIDQEKLAESIPFYREGIAVLKADPAAGTPENHNRILAQTQNLARFLNANGETKEALEILLKLLPEKEKLFPRDKFPNGHPALQRLNRDIGMIYFKLGEDRQSYQHLQRSLEMARALYPPEQYPNGNRDLLVVSYYDALFSYQSKDFKKAFAAMGKVVLTSQRLLESVATGSPEAESLNFAAKMPGAQHPFLSMARILDLPGSECYPPIWKLKATIMRQLEKRQLALSRSDNPEVQKKIHQLLEVRRSLSRLLLQTGEDNNPQLEKLLSDQSREKEQLERDLAKLLPDFQNGLKILDDSPADLAALLPADGAFVDFVRYNFVDLDMYKEKREVRLSLVPHYAVFVVRKGKPPERIDLGPAQPIEKALTDWRTSIAADAENPAAAASLRRLLWQPLTKKLGAEVNTVWIAPDGPLNGCPWPALPGRKEGSVLLEDHVLAIVPNGPFLLDRLRTPPVKPKRNSIFVVGGVDYAKGPAAGGERLRGPIPATDRKLAWGNLPGTVSERDRLVELAKAYGLEVQSASGQDASAERLLKELPNASIVHLATHGFFADATFRSALSLDETKFRPEKREQCMLRERLTVGSRNPLALSGLVMAGANEANGGSAGIVTAEELVGLSLQGVQLAVLSACETGLGDVAAGEGVFSLQRAFHLAGTRNVVGSLWRLDDEHTAAMMSVFYSKMWVENKSPAVALREAQLTIYRHPERVALLAKERGPKLSQTVKLPIDEGKEAKPMNRSPVRAWAAFILSGPGM